MEFKDMSNETLLRHYICAKRQLKTLQSQVKQIETELDNRYDNGTLRKED